MEVLVAVSLLSLLSAGMLMAMRAGLDATNKANQRLMDNRRVAGIQRVLQQQIAGFIPVTAFCGAAGGDQRVRLPFFQGEPQAMRLASTYSLDEAWRGRAQILEYMVIPRESDRGVRLVVNEVLYTGPFGAGQLCTPGPLSEMGIPLAVFQPVVAGPRSFVLADRLEACRFAYLEPRTGPADRWVNNWAAPTWPRAIRVEMQPLETDPARLHPVTVTMPVPVRIVLWEQYGD
jgi:type II secretory pathway component PulJ